MEAPATRLILRLVDDEAGRRAVYRLRYDVFVDELGGGGPLVDHDARLERDRFDPFCDHLALFDPALPPGEDAVAVYRLMRDDAAREGIGFYSAGEYDLTPLERSGRRLLEFGRSCVRPDYRGGEALFRLWKGLADYVDSHASEILFGVASFHGTDPAALAHPLSFLHARHLAPPDLRVRATGPAAQRMDLLAPEAIDRRRAVEAMPPLLKSYLRLGGMVGDGAWIDRQFNTVDVCLIVDAARLSNRAQQLYRSLE